MLKEATMEKASMIEGRMRNWFLSKGTLLAGLVILFSLLPAAVCM